MRHVKRHLASLPDGALARIVGTDPDSDWNSGLYYDFGHGRCLLGHGSDSFKAAWYDSYASPANLELETDAEGEYMGKVRQTSEAEAAAEVIALARAELRSRGLEAADIAIDEAQESFVQKHGRKAASVAVLVIAALFIL